MQLLSSINCIITIGTKSQENILTLSSPPKTAFLKMMIADLGFYVEVGSLLHINTLTSLNVKY